MWHKNRLTKTARLEEQLVSEIADRKLKPHDRFMSEAEIIEKFGINQTTVRQTLTRLSAKGFIYRISGKGTFVSPRARTTPILIVTSQVGRPNPFARMGLADFIDGMRSSELGAIHGCYPLLISTEEYLNNANEIHLIYKNLGGIVFFSDPKPYIATHQTLFANGIAALFYGADLNIAEHPELNAMVYPQKKLVALALEHLKEQGYERIGIVSARNHPHRSQRTDLFYSWMKQNFPNGEEPLFINIDDAALSTEGPLDPRVAEAMGARKMDAWFCVDDSAAYRFMNAVYRAGYRVPEDAALVSISNFPVCKQTVCPTTSVEIPFLADGDYCIEMLGEMQMDLSISRQRSCMVHVEVRKSSTPKHIAQPK